MVFPITILQRYWMSLLINFVFQIIVLSAPINASTKSSSSLPIYHVPTFEYGELIQNKYNTDYFENTLETTGLMAIRVPISTNRNNNHDSESSNFVNFAALTQHLCQCSEKMDSSNISGADQIMLKDGLTVRSTIATATQGIDSLLALPSDEIQQVCSTPISPHFKMDVAENMEEVRDLVSQIVSNAFLPALDYSLKTNEPQRSNPSPLLITKLGLEYHSLVDIVKDATHLEHFHVYDKTTDTTDSSIYTHMHPYINEHNAVPIDPALDWHTDAGLFLAFLPGSSCRGQDSQSINDDDSNDSFRILQPEANNQNMGGVEMRVQFPKANAGEVIVAIMLGTGAEHWLYPNRQQDDDEATLQLRATRHSVKMRQGEKRVWYGRMYLVPAQTIVQTKPNNMTFSEMRNSVAIHSSHRRYGDQSNNPQDAASIGCGFHSDESSISPTIVQQSQIETLDQSYRSSRHRRKLQHGVDPSDCSNSINGVDFYCWMQCPILKEGEGSTFDPNSNINFVQHHVNQGESLYCAHLETLAVTKDIQQAIDACTDDRGIAGGTMDAGCSNVWFPTVEGAFTYLQVEQDDISSSSLLEEKYCYGATSMYMQGFEWEGSTCVVYLFESWTITTRAAFIWACFGTVLFGIFVEWIIKQRRLLVEQQTIPLKKMLISMSLYGIQLTMGYLIMLVVMTYSGPLVLSVVLGLMCGHVLTNWNSVFGGDDENGEGIELSSGATPCCVAEKKLAKGQKMLNGKQDTHSTTNGSTEKESTSEDEKVMENCCCDDLDL